MSAVLAVASAVTHTVSLSEAVEFNPKLDRASLPEHLEVSFVPMAAVEAGSGRMEPTQVRPFSEVKKGFTYFCDGDVLFAKITPCMENGKMAVAHGLRNGIGFGSTEFHVLRPRAGVDARYVYHFVSSASFRREAAHHMTGAVGQKRVPLSFLQQSQLQLPPIDEQRRIVAEIEKQFSRLDEAVAKLQRVKASLRRYEASTLNAALAGQLVPNEADLARAQNRDFESADELLQRIRRIEVKAGGGRRSGAEPATDVGELPALPAGWSWAQLSSITTIKGGITVDKKRADVTARPVPYLRVANVQRGYLDLAEVKFIDAPTADIDALQLMRGDILFNEGGDRDKLGRGWIWEGQLPECIHQNHVFRARPMSADISPKLISWWGNTFGKDYFQREGKQTTNLASINLSKLSKFPVPVPPLAEQHRIVAEVDRRLSIVREVEAEVDANLERAQALQQAVLAKALQSP